MKMDFNFMLEVLKVGNFILLGILFYKFYPYFTKQKKNDRIYFQLMGAANFSCGIIWMDLYSPVFYFYAGLGIVLFLFSFRFKYLSGF